MQRSSIVRSACRQLSRQSGSFATHGKTPRWIRQSGSTLQRIQPSPLNRSITRQLRQSSSDAEGASPRPLTDRGDNEDAELAAKRKAEVEAYKAQQPSYQLTFTCGKCMEPSTHIISRQGYHKGTVLVTCPGCKNKHLISDHLKIFSDKGVTLEDIMKEKGQTLKRGVLGADGDVEFYNDDNEPKQPS